jgi:protein-ribulosamine 3-kinase
MYAVITKKQISNQLSKALFKQVEVFEVSSVGGGSISHTYKLKSSVGMFFLKAYDGENAIDMFTAEAKGLELLRSKSKITIPKVISLYNEDGSSYLFMDYISSSIRNSNYWQELAIKMAELHQQTNAQFGLKDNNFIGSLPQQNDFTDNWLSFFINHRILPLVQLATDRNLVSNLFVDDIERLLKNLANLLPIERPALVHGDLWSGNLMVDSQGHPCLIDPAVYYGHREMDLAFSHLFGGFEQSFYDAYQEVYPLEPDFDSRVDIYNIYPLLVHLNLFGKSYLRQIESILANFK